jgi:hypothetical protein
LTGWTGIFDFFESWRGRKEAEMGRYLRIFLLAFFILTVSLTPLVANGGNGGGGNHGGGHGGGWGGGGNHGGGRGGGCVPEIDPSLAPSAIAFLSGGLLILKSKSGKKK